MYYYFKLGLGEKRAYYDQEESGVPWGKAALLALLAGGGAYAYGRYAQNSPLQGFSQGVDNSIINPLLAKYKGLTTSPLDEAMAMHKRVSQQGFLGQFKDVNHMSQLQGTEYYAPGKLEGAANVAGAGAVMGMHQGMVRPLGVMTKSVPYLGKAVRTVGKVPGLKLLGKSVGPLSAVSTLPDTMQLGDKLNDSMGIQNNIARGAVKGTMMAGGMAGALHGARAGAMLGSRLGAVGTGVGTLLGGAVGTFAPGILNGTWNHYNNSKLLQNQVAARTGALKNEFTTALQSKQNGNPNPMQAWYGLQSNPGQLKMTVSQMQDSPDIQREIKLNAPNGSLYSR